MSQTISEMITQKQQELGIDDKIILFTTPLTY